MKIQILTNLKALVDEVNFALQNNKGFIFSGVIDGQLPICIAGVNSYCTKDIFEAYKRNNNEIYSLLEKNFENKIQKIPDKKPEGITAEVNKKEDGTFTINF